MIGQFSKKEIKILLIMINNLENLSPQGGESNPLDSISRESIARSAISNTAKSNVNERKSFSDAVSYTHLTLPTKRIV